MAIRINSTEIGASGRKTQGLKGISLKKDDYIVATLPIRHDTDDLAIFSQNGQGKRVPLSDFMVQKKNGKGLICYKVSDSTGPVTAATLSDDEDKILIVGDKTGVCISAKDIPVGSRGTIGNILIKNNKITSVSKV